MYYYLRSLSAPNQHVVPTHTATVNPSNISVPGRVCCILSADRDSQTGSCKQFLDVSNDDLPEPYLLEGEYNSYEYSGIVPLRMLPIVLICTTT